MWTRKRSHDLDGSILLVVRKLRMGAICNDDDIADVINHSAAPGDVYLKND